jgi:hypothetical protein
MGIRNDKEETIKRLAYVIWQSRCRSKDPDANNDKQNYFRAKHCLYPEDMKQEELNHL